MRCPECGAEGFADAFVLQGRVVAIHRSAALTGPAAIYVAALVADRAIDLSLRGVFRLDLVPLIVVLVVLLWFFVRSIMATRNTTAWSQRYRGVWLVHPRGVIIRSGSATRHIPVEAIARIDCTDSLSGQMSTLVIRPHRWSAHWLSLRPMLFVQGALEDRRTQWRRAREILGLWRATEAGLPCIESSDQT